MDDTQTSQSCILDQSIKSLVRRPNVVPLISKETPRGASRFIVLDERYTGQYVAMPSFNDRTVLAYGHDRAVVRETAMKKGCRKPIIFHVDEEY